MSTYAQELEVRSLSHPVSFWFLGYIGDIRTELQAPVTHVRSSIYNFGTTLSYDNVYQRTVEC